MELAFSCFLLPVKRWLGRAGAGAEAPGLRPGPVPPSVPRRVLVLMHRRGTERPGSTAFTTASTQALDRPALPVPPPVGTAPVRRRPGHSPCTACAVSRFGAAALKASLADAPSGVSWGPHCFAPVGSL